MLVGELEARSEGYRFDEEEDEEVTIRNCPLESRKLLSLDEVRPVAAGLEDALEGCRSSATLGLAIDDELDAANALYDPPMP